MSHALRHSHVAVYGDVGTLAQAAGTHPQFAEDDLGPYSFFDLIVRRSGGSQRVRFASHDGDSMVHVLAEQTDQVRDLARALAKVGITRRSKLSISTDPSGNPLRDEQEIKDKIPVRIYGPVKAREVQKISKNRLLAKRRTRASLSQKKIKKYS